MRNKYWQNSDTWLILNYPIGNIAERRKNVLKIEYKNDKVKGQCTSVKTAKKLFGGDETLATCLHSRVNALENADTLRDIGFMNYVGSLRDILQ